METIKINPVEIKTKIVDAQGNELVPVKHGHWIGVSQTNMTILEKLFFPSRVFECSVCGNYLDFDGVNAGRGSENFCPNCGARMDEVKEDEEPEINPCRICEDYDGKDGCLSNGGCGEGEKMYEVTIDKETGLPVMDNSFARVVRCKDCKYLNIINEEPVYACCGKHNHIFYLWEEDIRKHFCSWGVRTDEVCDEHI